MNVYKVQQIEFKEFIEFLIDIETLLRLFYGKFLPSFKAAAMFFVAIV